jgi:hypothetical protein
MRNRSPATLHRLPLIPAETDLDWRSTEPLTHSLPVGTRSVTSQFARGPGSCRRGLAGCRRDSRCSSAHTPSGGPRAAVPAEPVDDQPVVPEALTWR